MSRDRKLTNQKKERVFLKYMGKCSDCGNPSWSSAGWHNKLDPYNKKIRGRGFHLGGLEIHHIVQFINGGSDEIKNLILLCPTCHRKRHGAKKIKDLDWGREV